MDCGLFAALERSLCARFKTGGGGGGRLVSLKCGIDNMLNRNSNDKINN